MKASLHRLWAFLKRWKQLNDEVAPLVLIASLRLVTWFLAMLVLMVGAGAWLSFEGATTLPPHRAEPLRLVAWLDLATMAFFAVQWCMNNQNARICILSNQRVASPHEK